MRIVPLSLREAEAFLKSHGRHYVTPAEPICAIGLMEEERPVGVDPCMPHNQLHGAAILGRMGNDGALSHIYADGVSEGYTKLYGACWRTLKAMGYEKAIL